LRSNGQKSMSLETNVIKTKHVRWRNVSDDMCRPIICLGSVWDWFDVNRSTRRRYGNRSHGTSNPDQNITNKLPTTVLDTHHLTCGISSLLRFEDLILLTLLLVHLTLHASPHHTPCLLYHHLSLSRPLTPDL